MIGWAHGLLTDKRSRIKERRPDFVAMRFRSVLKDHHLFSICLRSLPSTTAASST